jgi:hypothetical protein
MPSPNSKLLQQALAPMLKVAEFKKTSSTWHRQRQAVIAVVNLQGSQWGPAFYVNLGVYFRELGGKDRPCEAECHIRSRLDGHVEDRARLAQLLDFEFNLDLHSRGVELSQTLKESGLRWLDYVETPQGAKEWCERHPKSPFMAGVLREYLGLPLAPNQARLRARTESEQS